MMLNVSIIWPVRAQGEKIYKAMHVCYIRTKDVYCNADVHNRQGHVCHICINDVYCNKNVPNIQGHVHYICSNGTGRVTNWSNIHSVGKYLCGYNKVVTESRKSLKTRN